MVGFSCDDGDDVTEVAPPHSLPPTQNKFDVRIFPVYFRVGFYGPKAAELQGKEFIYKVPGETRLGHIQTDLREKHAKKVGGVVDDICIMQA